MKPLLTSLVTQIVLHHRKKCAPALVNPGANKARVVQPFPNGSRPYLLPWYLRRNILVIASVVLFGIAGCNRDKPTPTPDLEAGLVATVEGSTAQSTSADGQANNNQITAPQPTATTTPLPAPVGTLTLWHSWAEADGDALATILLAFNEQHPELQVNTLFVAYNDLPQSYAEAVQTNAGPDLVLMPNWWIGEMVTAEVAQSIDALIDAGTLDAAVLDTFWPATLDNMRWEGELYGIPTNFELVSLFYNRSLIDTTALPKTMDELLSLAQADPTTGIGLYASLYHVYWGFPAYGALLLDGEGQAILDQTDGAAAYLRWLVALSEVDGTFVDSDYGMLLDRFKKGEFAFMVDGPWSIAELRQALGENLAVTRLPDGTVGAAMPWLSADGIFLNPQSTPQQHYLALLLAQHFTTVESGEALATLANRIPANRHVELIDPLLQGFVQQAATAQSLPALPEMDEVWGYGGDMLLKVLDGKEDPARVVLETATLINEANGK